jgi:uncharacterized protein (DUF433 family)
MAMSTAAAPTTHVRVDDRGRAWLVGTETKVIEVVLDHLANGWSPDEIYFQHEGTLSLAQIYAALSYYYDHQADFDDEIRRQVQRFDAMHAQAGESPFRRRMRDLGKLR